MESLSEFTDDELKRLADRPRSASVPASCSGLERLSSKPIEDRVSGPERQKLCFRRTKSFEQCAASHLYVEEKRIPQYKKAVSRRTTTRRSRYEERRTSILETPVESDCSLSPSDTNMRKKNGVLLKLAQDSFIRGDRRLPRENHTDLNDLVGRVGRGFGAPESCTALLITLISLFEELTPEERTDYTEISPFGGDRMTIEQLRLLLVSPRTYPSREEYHEKTSRQRRVANERCPNVMTGPDEEPRGSKVRRYKKAVLRELDRLKNRQEMREHQERMARLAAKVAVGHEENVEPVIMETEQTILAVQEMLKIQQLPKQPFMSVFEMGRQKEDNERGEDPLSIPRDTPDSEDLEREVTVEDEAMETAGEEVEKESPLMETVGAEENAVDSAEKTTPMEVVESEEIVEAAEEHVVESMEEEPVEEVERVVEMTGDSNLDEEVIESSDADEAEDIEDADGEGIEGVEYVPEVEEAGAEEFEAEVFSGTEESMADVVTAEEVPKKIGDANLDEDVIDSSDADEDNQADEGGDDGVEAEEVDRTKEVEAAEIEAAETTEEVGTNMVGEVESEGDVDSADVEKATEEVEPAEFEAAETETIEEVGTDVGEGVESEGDVDSADLEEATEDVEAPAAVEAEGTEEVGTTTAETAGTEEAEAEDPVSEEVEFGEFDEFDDTGFEELVDAGVDYYHEDGVLEEVANDLERVGVEDAPVEETTPEEAPPAQEKPSEGVKAFVENCMKESTPKFDRNLPLGFTYPGVAKCTLAKEEEAQAEDQGNIETRSREGGSGSAETTFVDVVNIDDDETQRKNDNVLTGLHDRAAAVQPHPEVEASTSKAKRPTARASRKNAKVDASLPTPSDLDAAEILISMGGLDAPAPSTSTAALASPPANLPVPPPLVLPMSINLAGPFTVPAPRMNWNPTLSPLAAPQSPYVAPVPHSNPYHAFIQPQPQPTFASFFPPSMPPPLTPTPTSYPLSLSMSIPSPTNSPMFANSLLMPNMSPVMPFVPNPAIQPVPQPQLDPLQAQWSIRLLQALNTVSANKATSPKTARTSEPPPTPYSSPVTSIPSPASTAAAPSTSHNDMPPLYDRIEARRLPIKKRRLHDESPELSSSNASPRSSSSPLTAMQRRLSAVISSSSPEFVHPKVEMMHMKVEEAAPEPTSAVVHEVEDEEDDDDDDATIPYREEADDFLEVEEDDEGEDTPSTSKTKRRSRKDKESKETTKRKRRPSNTASTQPAKKARRSDSEKRKEKESKRRKKDQRKKEREERRKSRNAGTEAAEEEPTDPIVAPAEPEETPVAQADEEVVVLYQGKPLPGAPSAQVKAEPVDEEQNRVEMNCERVDEVNDADHEASPVPTLQENDVFYKMLNRCTFNEVKDLKYFNQQETGQPLSPTEGQITNVLSGQMEQSKIDEFIRLHHELMFNQLKLMLQDEVLPSLRHLRVFADIIQNKVSVAEQHREVLIANSTISLRQFEPVPPTFEKDMLSRIKESPKLAALRQGVAYMDGPQAFEFFSSKVELMNVLKTKAITKLKINLQYNSIKNTIKDVFEEMSNLLTDDETKMKHDELRKEVCEKVLMVHAMSYFVYVEYYPHNFPLYNLAVYINWIYAGWGGWLARGGAYQIYLAVVPEKLVGREVLDSAKHKKEAVENKVLEKLAPVMEFEKNKKTREFVLSYMKEFGDEELVLTMEKESSGMRKDGLPFRCEAKMGSQVPLHSAGCTLWFKTKELLDAHVRLVHPTKKPLRCLQCYREFHYEKTLQLHKEVFHIADNLYYEMLDES